MTPNVHVLEAEVLDHREVAPEHFVLTLDAPVIAGRVRPGQFVMVRSPGSWDPLLPRAFSVYHADEEGGLIEVMYRQVGRGTARLRLQEPGQSVSVWGPLGNWFRLPQGDRVILVGGGVGVPPLVFWGAYLARMAVPMEVTALIGAATEKFLVGIDHLREARVDVQLATDDGSAGHRGYVTDLLRPLLDEGTPHVYACGPMPMLAAVARLTEPKGILTELALEAPMACGVGACLGCTVPRRDGGFARVCTDGPVFSPGDIAW